MFIKYFCCGLSSHTSPRVNRFWKARESPENLNVGSFLRRLVPYTESQSSVHIVPLDTLFFGGCWGSSVSLCRCGGQRTTCWSWFSPSTLWVLGNRTWAVRLGGKCLNLLKHLASQPSLSEKFSGRNVSQLFSSSHALTQPNSHAFK